MHFRAAEYENPTAPSSRGSRWILLALMLVAAPVLGCGKKEPSSPPPQSALSASREAQAQFRVLHKRWTGSTAAERQKLKEPLEQFLERFPSDNRARLVRVYLAWLHVERGELAVARDLAAQTREGPRGAARDFANVAEAAVLVGEKKPEKALALLEPLRGKLVDPEERLLFGEQLVRAALAAKEWTKAVAYMMGWLSEASTEDSDAVMASIGRLVRRVPNAEQLDSLKKLDRLTRSESPDDSSAAKARAWMRKTLWRRLADVAIENEDGQLAEQLLASGPARLRIGDVGERLQQLAAGGSVLPRVAGRAVGLVLSLADETSRRRSSEAAAGMSRALGLPKAAGKHDAVRLFTRDDGGEMDGVERALAALAGDGATVLVAGFDDESARRASSYAEKSSIPVVLLRHPKKLGSRHQHTFVLGMTSNDGAEALEATLRKDGVTSVARVGPGGVPCDSTAVAGQPRFPVGQWLRTRAEALLLLGSVGCSRDAMAEARAAGLSPTFAFGFDSAGLLLEVAEGRGLAVGAGTFPYDADVPSEVTRWRKTTGSTPTWFETLGHDAALLAEAALKGLPLDRVDDAKAVAELHARALRRLAEAKAPLWSTESRGFAGRRVMSRKLGTVRR